MRRTKFLSVVIVALLVINAGTLVYLFLGQNKTHKRHPHGMRKGTPADYIIDKLQLDSKQQIAFMKLQKEHRKKMRAIHEQLEETRNRFFDGLKTSAVDSVESKKLQVEIGNLMGQIHGTTFEHFTQVRQLCKPEQQELFDEFIQDILRALAPPPPGRGHHPPPHH